jgi:glycosyltransferase involved in cell wall biosynthesis
MHHYSRLERVAIYLPSLRGGGAERIMVTTANAMSARGITVDLVLAKAEGPNLRDVASGIRVVDLGASRVISSLPGLVRYLRRERPEAVLSAMNHANVMAVIARQAARVPLRLVVSEHNMISTQSTGQIPFNRRVVLKLMRRAYARADAIVAVSNGVADDLVRTIGIPRDRVTTIYNPTDCAKIRRLAEADPGHPWMVPGGIPVILGVGRLTRQKDFSTLIRAFAKVRQCHPARLIILGEGELRPALEQEIREHGLDDDVLLPGFVDNPYAYMSRCAMFVLSSAWEGLPGVLIEAMACGARIVSTDCPSGPSEILENGKWGRLVPVGDEKQLADAILSTMDDNETSDVACRAAQFGIDNAMDGYLGLLQGQSSLS